MLNRPATPRAAEFERWGIDPDWSRLVEVPGHDGVTRTWHVLDHGPAEPLATKLRQWNDHVGLPCTHTMVASGSAGP